MRTLQVFVAVAVLWLAAKPALTQNVAGGELCQQDPVWRQSLCICIDNSMLKNLRLTRTVKNDIGPVDESFFGLADAENVTDLNALQTELKKFDVNFKNVQTAQSQYETTQKYQDESANVDVANKFEKVKRQLKQLSDSTEQSLFKLDELIPNSGDPLVPARNNNTTVLNLYELYTAINYLTDKYEKLLGKWDDTCQNCSSTTKRRRRSRRLRKCRGKNKRRCRGRGKGRGRKNRGKNGRKNRRNGKNGGSRKLRGVLRML